MTYTPTNNNQDIKEEPSVTNNKFQSKNIFQDDQSLIDFDTEFNLNDTINNFYVDENDPIDFNGEEINKTRKIFSDLTEQTNEKANLKGLAKGLGLEIGVGLGADAVLAPLLATGPVGIAAYGGGQFAIGYYTNIQAQKLRGVKDISQAEAISAGLFQVIPAGSTAKIGKGGLKKAALQGAGFATGETFVRDLLGDDVSRDEYLASIGLGGAFGTAFKGSIDGLGGVLKKIKNKTPIEADKILTKKDKKIIDEAVNNLDQVGKKQQVDLESKGVNIEQQKQTVERTFVIPNQFKRTKPNYGSASIIFESDFDKLAWSLRLGKKNPPQKEQEMLQAFISQGFTEKEVRLHGANIHKRIKGIVTEKTGSATASPSNTQGLTIEVPADAKYAGGVKTSLNKLDSKKQDLGDVSKNPQQISFIKSLKPKQQKTIQEMVKVLKDADVFTGSKSQQQTKLEGLGMFDDGVVRLQNTKFIKEYGQAYSKLYNLVPSDSLNYAIAQTITLQTEEVANVNKRLIEAIKTKNTELIDQSIDELSDSLLGVEEWLKLGIPLRTQTARTLKSFGIKPESGIEGKTADEVMNLTAAEKSALTEKQPDIEIDLNQSILQNEKFKTDLKDALQKATETDDYSELVRLTTELDGAAGSVEKMVAMKNADAIQVGKFADKVARIYNEIGINALLSGPTTQKINLYSGVAQTFLKAFNNFSGSTNFTELEAAKKHLFALFQNFDFALNAWKRSWDMEDNFINLGNIKGETSQRYMISSDKQYFPFKAVDRFGKFIRLPSRLMTATDALVQAPNILAAANYQAYMEGVKLGKTGDELNQYIKGHVDGIISYFLKNSKGDVGRVEIIDGQEVFTPDAVTQRILTNAKEFGKQITFTQDIRTEDIFGGGASKLNNLAVQNPVARFFFTFTRTPTNIIKEVMRYTPVINTPVVRRLPNQVPFFGGKYQNINPFNALFLPEMKADLLSPDPLVRANATGQIRMGYAFGLLIAGLTFDDYLLPDYDLNKDQPPHFKLTGGGPNYFTKEGASMWISMYKNGWRPYSRAYLKYDENGEPMYKNGEPVYEYKTYENLPDPIVSFVRMMVDFTQGGLFVKDKEFGEFTAGFATIIGRNLFNRSYTQQINEAINLFSAIPTVGKNVDPEDNVDYRTKKILDYVGRQLSVRSIPYSSFLSKLHRLPADVLTTIGFTEQEARELAESKGDYSKLRWFMRPDTKTRAGDTANEDLDFGDEEFNKAYVAIQALDNILNKGKEIIPILYGGNAPMQVEHITGDPITYPQKSGLDLLSLAKHSTSKNHKYFMATQLIGRLLPEPPEIIRGSKFRGVGSKNFVPKKLDKKEYNALKVYVNNTTLRMGGRDVTIKQALDNYFDGTFMANEYKGLKSIIEEKGLNSQEGQLAAEKIFQTMNQINTKYINKGILEYTRDFIGEKEFTDRIKAKQNLQQNFVDRFTEQMNQMNLGTF